MLFASSANALIASTLPAGASLGLTLRCKCVEKIILPFKSKEEKQSKCHEGQIKCIAGYSATRIFFHSTNTARLITIPIQIEFDLN